jgi:hypothetical protein
VERSIAVSLVRNGDAHAELAEQPLAPHAA